MTDLRKSAETALVTLEEKLAVLEPTKYAETIEALRQALAQPQPVQFKCTVVDDGHPNGVPLSQWGRQPEQEPVAWILNRELFWHSEYQSIAEPNDRASPLYIAPPKREWVGLTDEDMREVRNEGFDLLYGARWAERKLKEKNT